MGSAHHRSVASRRLVSALALLGLCAAACTEAHTQAAAPDVHDSTTTVAGIADVVGTTLASPIVSSATTSVTTGAPNSPPTSAPTSVTTGAAAPSDLVPGLMADVEAAAHLGPVPAGTPVANAATDMPILYADGCHVVWAATSPKQGCVFGDTTSSVTVVVTGDSHAAAFFGAFDEAGKANHWKIVMVTKQGCPTADVSVYSAQNPSVHGVPYVACDQWRPHALAYIASLHPALVVFPLLSTRTVVGKPGAAGVRAWADGLGRSIDAVTQPGTKVLVIGDTPRTNGHQVPGCVAAHRNNVSPCGNPRSAAVDPAHMAIMAAAAAAHHAAFVDPSNWICNATFCPAVIGTSIVYRDDHHLTDRFSRYRAPQVAEAVRAALNA